MAYKFKATPLYDGTMPGIMPRISTLRSACFDIALTRGLIVPAHTTICEDLFLQFDIPSGHCVQLYPRSSTLLKYNLMVPTSIIDEDYIGSIHLIAHNVGDECVTLERGVRLVQGMLMKLLPNNKYTLLKYMQQGFISDILDDNNITAFRSGGIGSTGK